MLISKWTRGLTDSKVNSSSFSKTGFSLLMMFAAKIHIFIDKSYFVNTDSIYILIKPLLIRKN